MTALAPPPKPDVIGKCFTRIYVPTDQEDKLALALDEAAPPDRRLCTAGGLFLVKPTVQNWLGFSITLAICLALVGNVFALLA